MNEENNKINFEDKIVELNESNKDKILNFISENVLKYFGEECAVSTEEKKLVSKNILIKNYTKEIAENKLRIFSCIIEDTVLGTIALKNDLYVQLFFVDENIQNKGIGTSLLNYVQRKYDYLSVIATKETEQLYKKNGFFKNQDVMSDNIYMEYSSKEKTQGHHATK